MTPFVEVAVVVFVALVAAVLIAACSATMFTSGNSGNNSFSGIYRSGFGGNSNFSVRSDNICSSGRWLFSVTVVTLFVEVSIGVIVVTVAAAISFEEAP